MVKPASSLCNMRCAYCFYHDVAENRESFNYGMMSRETARLLIEKALAFAKGKPVYFAFQGGEPLLAGIDFFRFFTRTVKEKNKKHSAVSFSMQTNGLEINRDWAVFLRQEKFLVGLSLDGGLQASRYRLKVNGQSSWHDVLGAAGLLRRGEVDFNILTVLTGHCAEHIAETYRFFKKRGFRYLQFIPCLRPFDCSEIVDNDELYMTPEQYADFLIQLFKLYVRDYLRGEYTSVRQLDNYVRLYLGGQPEQCGMAGHCTFQYVVEGNGNVYPCDFYCTDKWLLGNIHERAFQDFSQGARRFIEGSLSVPGRCKGCKYYPFCRGGGCKRLRESRDYCEAYRAFFESSLPLFRVFNGEKRKAGIFS